MAGGGGPGAGGGALRARTALLGGGGGAGVGGGREVGAQPALLGRAGAAAAGGAAVRVERDQVPGADVVAVVALAAVTGRPALVAGAVEVVEEARRAGGEVLVVADRRARDALDTAPGRGGGG